MSVTERRFKIVYNQLAHIEKTTQDFEKQIAIIREQIEHIKSEFIYQTHVFNNISTRDESSTAYATMPMDAFESLMDDVDKDLNSSKPTNYIVTWPFEGTIYWNDWQFQNYLYLQFKQESKINDEMEELTDDDFKACLSLIEKSKNSKLKNENDKYNKKSNKNKNNNDNNNTKFGFPTRLSDRNISPQNSMNGINFTNLVRDHEDPEFLLIQWCNYVRLHIHLRQDLRLPVIDLANRGLISMKRDEICRLPDFGLNSGMFPQAKKLFDYWHEIDLGKQKFEAYLVCFVKIPTARLCLVMCVHV